VVSLILCQRLIQNPTSISSKKSAKRGGGDGGSPVQQIGRLRVTHPGVKAFLDTLHPETRKLVLALRNVVCRTVSHAEESVLWGGLSYHRPEIGGRVKGAVCQIGVKRNEVRLDFIHGIRLVDPCGLLQGNRLSKRFIPIGSVADVERPEVAALIREAAALDPAEWKWPVRAPRVF
jgi:hypothetical protein